MSHKSVVLQTGRFEIAYTETDKGYRLDKSLVLPLHNFKFRFPRFSNRHGSSFNPFSNTLTIGVGFEWDGASGPAIDTDNALVASCAHDFLYGLPEEWRVQRRLTKKMLQKQADKLYRHLLIEASDNNKTLVKIRAFCHYVMVSLFGRRHIK